MLLSRRIICILLPHRGAGRRSPTPRPNPSLAPPLSVPVARLLLLLRPRDAASPLPEAAIWEGGGGRGP
uniref:Uncharacterized protein n=1 Tax=Arundo donax TaxID=35708 RepID=A0A0A9EZF8_ARUDO